MNNDLLIKCFIAFCIGAIVYKFISDRYLTNIIEGQCLADQGTGECIVSGEPTITNTDGSPGQSCNRIEQESGLAPADFCSNCIPTGSNPTEQLCGCCMWSNVGGIPPGDPRAEPQEPGTVDSGTNLMDTIPIDNIQQFIDNINDNIFKSSIRDNIDKLRLALMPTDHPVPEIPPSINSISTFEQFGEVSDALDYLELIVMNIADLDTENFGKFIGSIMNSANTEYCSTDEDLNAYIISIILLQYYNINIESEQKYINISNKLSKYIPTILEKVQSLNETCDDSNKKIKSNIMDTMIYRLFKNNNTVINIGSLDSLVNELNKLDRVYGVVILLCITYIVVKFLGMFNMKMEV